MDKSQQDAIDKLLNRRMDISTEPMTLPTVFVELSLGGVETIKFARSDETGKTVIWQPKPRRSAE